MKDVSSFSGLNDNDVVLMIHADDAGLCHSENRATIHCLENGSVNSCSVMVNCPGFDEMASYLRLNPQFDHGIHLTLTCEWLDYKFGPVLSADEVPSLVDENGHFFKDRKTLLSNARPEEVRKEIRAQIQKGLDFGLQPSHIDTHMYSMGISSEVFEVYRETGLEFNLPILLNERLLAEVAGIDPAAVLSSSDFLIPYVHFGRFDLFTEGKLDAFYRKTIENLNPGLHMILIHPAFDDQEMKAITREHPNFGSAWRQIDADFFSSQDCKTLLKEKGVRMINWTDIRELL
jgi:predicted glycoside hydrolase/deacetylase ChbG (UPF0249 family)